MEISRRRRRHLLSGEPRTTVLALLHLLAAQRARRNGKWAGWRWILRTDRPVGTGSSLRYWEGNNSGGLSRCISNCTAAGASWSFKRGGWGSDTQSFILPINLFHGGIAGGDDCAPAGTPGGCGHLVAGTTRVWETVTGDAASTTTWYVTNNPTTQNLTKTPLGSRSFITQVKYSPKFQSVAIVGTNDGNVQIGFNLGTGTQAQGNWVNVTGNNAILPNRPVLGIALDPSVAVRECPSRICGRWWF